MARLYLLAPIVQKVDNAIQWIISTICIGITDINPLNSDLSIELSNV